MKRIRIFTNCPFCGCKSNEILKDDPIKGFQIGCVNCGARGPAGFKSEKDACLAYDNGDTGFNRVHIFGREFSDR